MYLFHELVFQIGTYFAAIGSVPIRVLAVIIKKWLVIKIANSMKVLVDIFDVKNFS